MKISEEDLVETVTILRRLGIVRLRTGEFEVELGTAPGQEPEPQVDNRAEVKKVLVKEGSRGHDGLTADEQIDLYGVVLDATPPEYEEH